MIELLFLIGVIAALVMLRRMKARLAAVEARLAAVDSRLALLAAPPSATATATATAPAQPEAPQGAAAETPVESVAAPSLTPDRTGQAAPADAPATPAPAIAAAAAPPSVPVPAEAAPAGPGLEERLGTRWVVWIGGVALALGAIFLVRYSIEQGLVGPGARIFLGALLATALIAGGEWLRRNEKTTGLPELPYASIPAILTAAGTTAAYATVYAAHGLYDFIGAGPAFVLLGLVAVATLAAALLHGPALAGLGLVGAYVAPLLVSSEEPNFVALYSYLAIVTGAAFMLARARLWRWLAITAVVFSAFWILPGFIALDESAAPHAFYLIAVFALAAALIVTGFLWGPDADGDAIDGISSSALGVYVVLAMLLTIVSMQAPAALFCFAVLAVATLAVAWRAPAATAAVPVAAVCAALVVAGWAVGVTLESLVASAGVTSPAVADASRAEVTAHMIFGAGFAALFGAAGFLAQGRAERPIVSLLWAASAVVAPVAILIALYYRVAGFERSIPFAALALLLAALYAVATEMLGKRAPRPGLPSGQALFAVGAVASLALALTLALEKGWLTVALSLMAPGIAMIAEKRPLPMLRWLAASIAAVVLARIALEPRIVTDVGTTPVFNWLLWGYGVPALAFWVAGHILRGRADDIPARMMDSAAVVFTVLAVMLQIRHAVTGGDLYRPVASLAEVGMQVSGLLAIAIGLERVRGRTRSPVHNIAAMLAAGMALLLIVTGLLLVMNPAVERVEITAPFVNLILLSYGMPAVLAATLALVAKDTRPLWYRGIAAAAAVALTLAYLSLQVRRFYQGPVLSSWSVSDAEMWTYSIVWLAFGVLLLLLGLVIRSQPARLASAVVILLTVVKVFLLDLAGLGGVWRALSFIGLGLVLVGIGLLYQRLLFPARARPGPSAPPAEKTVAPG